jgi:amino acid adenylation domain-containing protein
VVSRSGPQTAYRRPVSAADWVSLSRPPGWRPYIQLLVEGHGSIDPDALTAAVAVASQACPGLRATLEGRTWVDSGVAPAVVVADPASFDRMRLDSPLLRERPGTGPLSSEVILVPGSPTTVVFRAHHAILDGRGALVWLRQVFRALRSEPVEAADDPRNSEIMAEEISRLLGDPPPEPQQDRPVPEWRALFGPLPDEPSESVWRRRVIDGTHPAAAARVARLVAAHGEGGGEGVLTIPVDLRPYLPGLHTTGPASSAVFIAVRSGDDWHDVHANLLTELRQQSHLIGRAKPSRLEMPLEEVAEGYRRLDVLVRRNPRLIWDKGIWPSMATVSHLGSVGLADLCADGFEATSVYSLGSISWIPEVDLLESGGRTEITVASMRGPDAERHTEELLDQIEEDLSPRRYRRWDANRPVRPAPPDTLVTLFARQVRATPHATAIAVPADLPGGGDGAPGSGPGAGDLTYAELSRRADAVAAALAARGVRRGDRIGLVAGRTPAAITAIWGILKAGAAYLPIDAGYPDARITQILTTATAPLCLLEPPTHHRPLLPPGCVSLTLDDTLWDQPVTPARPADTLRDLPAPWTDAPTGPDDLACVIFTSGSTGVPKGVEIEHGSLVNYVRWVSREAGIDASARMPLVASISFDMAGCAVFLPLLAGGTMLPVREVNAVTLRQVIEDGGVTALAITPSHLELINQSGIRHSTMRVIMTAGELLRRATALRALEIFGPQLRILCQWGPTETTIVNTSHEFDPVADTDAGVPFGQPMDNNTVHLLDGNGRHVPPGEPGEAYVGGIQVTRGYLGRPDLTRQRYVHLADGTRVYRTGDIARLLPAGTLSFVSRIDDQVKVAGHRIEPAEVAQTLEDHPHVRQAAVIPRTRPGRTDKELCAYVTFDPGPEGSSGLAGPPSPAGLKDFLAARLPRYMIPAAILAVPDIPRNANGKTDARQLPDPFAPFANPFAGTGSFAGPGPDASDEVTAAVAGVWARTLQVDPCAINGQADFHSLGGNSLLLLSMVNEVSKSVVERGCEEFMSQLHQIIREPTLHRVSELARQTRTRHLAAASSGPIGGR